MIKTPLLFKTILVDQNQMLILMIFVQTEAKPSWIIKNHKVVFVLADQWVKVHIGMLVDLEIQLDRKF